MTLRADRWAHPIRAVAMGIAGALAMVFAGALALAAGEPFVTDSPDATVATLHRGLVELAREQPQASVEQRYEALRPLIAATHDLPYIAEFALRRQWPDLSEADRERFVAAFERLSVTTYASRFRAVDETTFAATEPAQPQGARFEVATTIARADAAAVTLEYLLEPRGDDWKIINIVADGVSDLALKRAEYQRVLGSGTFDDLIAELEQQTARLR